jgi:hypothetical protein
VTNLPFLRALVRAPEVERAGVDTEWIEREFLHAFAALAGAPAPELALVAAALTDGRSAFARRSFGRIRDAARDRVSRGRSLATAGARLT